MVALSVLRETLSAEREGVRLIPQTLSLLHLLYIYINLAEFKCSVIHAGEICGAALFYNTRDLSPNPSTGPCIRVHASRAGPDLLVKLLHR